MAELKSIIVGDGFIEASFTGAASTNPNVAAANMKEHFQKILAASQENDCVNIVINFSEAEYEVDSNIFAEHQLASFLANAGLPAMRWAIVLPQTATTDRTHVENAAVNRGVPLRTFVSRDEAIAWITSE